MCSYSFTLSNSVTRYKKVGYFGSLDYPAETFCVSIPRLGSTNISNGYVSIKIHKVSYTYVKDQKPIPNTGKVGIDTSKGFVFTDEATKSITFSSHDDFYVQRGNYCFWINSSGIHYSTDGTYFDTFVS
jgi:hypothetical protein